MATLSHNACQKAPKLIQVFRLLRGKSAEWVDIGRELGVSFNQRRLLHINHTLSRDYKLEKVLSIWIESECSPVTWDYLIEVLEVLTYHDLKAAVIDFLKLQKKAFEGDRQHFLKATAECTGEITQLNIMLHGPPGVGKTSLSRIILGEDPLPKEEQNSTSIMANPVQTIATNQLMKFEGQFKKVSDEELICLIAKFLKDRMEQGEINFVGDTHAPISVDCTINALEEINDALSNVQPSSRIFSSKWHNLIDSGGLPQFQDMLPLLFRSPSFQIVLMRLTEGLEDKPKLRHTDGGENIAPDDLQLTNIQYIERACQIAAAADPPSLVMIVGTHKNMLRDVNATLATLEKGLDYLRKTYEHVILCTSTGNTIFPMDTMATGEERKEYTKEIQTAITAVTDVMAKPQLVPLRWFVFQLALRNKASVIRLNECIKLGHQLGMEKDAVEEALIFFDQSAFLLYYPDDTASGLVLTKVDPIIERLSRLVTATFNVPLTLQACHHLCTRLKEKGLFDNTFCDELFKGDFIDNLKNEDFLKLLVSLKLAILVNKKKQLYFLPSALFYSSPASAEPNGLAFGLVLKGINQLQTECCGRILPHGFFFTTLFELLQANKKNCQFELCSNSTFDDELQYRDQITVCDMTGNILGTVILSNKKTWIQVTMSSRDNPYTCCYKLYEAVEEAIDRAISQLEHTGIASYDVVYPCPYAHDGTSHSSYRSHYCTLSPGKYMYTCCDDEFCTGIITPDINYWTEAIKVVDLNDERLLEPSANKGEYDRLFSYPVTALDSPICRTCATLIDDIELCLPTSIQSYDDDIEFISPPTNRTYSHDADDFDELGLPDGTYRQSYDDIELSRPTYRQSYSYPAVQSTVYDDIKSPEVPDELSSVFTKLSDWKHFLKAMAECKKEITQLNVMLHGPPGVGKTSLSRIILGEDPLPKEEQNSTSIMANPVRAITTNQLMKFEGQFRKISDEELIRLIAEFLKDQTKSGEIDFEGDAPPIPPDSTVDALKEINDVLPNVQPSPRMFSSKWHNLIDSGGQPQFQDMLPLLFRSPSFQIVLMRLTERLEDKPKMRYTVGGESIVPPDELHLTNLQYIERACQIAAAANPPLKVMIVGTHKDMLRDVTATLATLEEGLNHLRETYEHVILLSSAGKMIFSMDTMATGEERKGYTKEMQDAITVATDVLAKPQPIPLRWFVFQLALRNKAFVIRMNDCIELGLQLGMEKDAVEKALIFFNQSAFLLYYPDDTASGLVLTKVDPIIERLSRIVTTTFNVPFTLRAYNHLCTRLKKKGLFDAAFCELLFSGADFADDLSILEFLKLLVSLRLAVLVNEKEQLYFLPSALSCLSPTESVLSKDGLAFILKDHDESVRILPHSFYFTSIVELLSNQFEIPGMRSARCSNSIMQYRNKIQVCDKSDKIPGIMTLSDKTFWIQVSVPEIIPEYCPTICKAVEGAIDLAKERLKHSTAVTSITEVFPCPIDGHNDHHCTVTTDNKHYTCYSNPAKVKPVTKDMVYWIEAIETIKAERSWSSGILNVSDEDLKIAKEKIFRVLNHEPDFPGSAKGIAFVVGITEPNGVYVDIQNVQKTFHGLKFLVYPDQNLTCSELACLVKAAADTQYPITIKFIAFYFAGHGGIDSKGRPFIMPMNCDKSKNILLIDHNILEPFRSRKDNFSLMNGKRRQCLFLFDCCLSEASTLKDQQTESEFKLQNPPPDSVVAYSTSVGSKSQGDSKKGGLWTRHLCQNLSNASNICLSKILISTRSAVEEDPTRKNDGQLPHHEWNTGSLYLKRKPLLNNKGNALENTSVNSTQLSAVEDVKGALKSPIPGHITESAESVASHSHLNNCSSSKSSTGTCTSLCQNGSLSINKEDNDHGLQTAANLGNSTKDLTKNKERAPSAERSRHTGSHRDGCCLIL